MNYTDQGYNEFLSREPIVEERQMIDAYSYDTSLYDISGEKVINGKIISSNNVFSFDLENDQVDFFEGSIERIILGLLADGKVGITLLSDNGEDLVRLDANGLQINQGKFFLLDENNKEIFGSSGFSFPNIISTDAIYTDQTYEISVSDPAFRDMEGLIFNITTKKKQNLFIIATARGSTDLVTEPTRIRLAINNVIRKPEGTIYSTQVGSCMVFSNEILNPGSYTMKLQFGKGVVATDAGIIEGVRFSYLLF